MNMAMRLWLPNFINPFHKKTTEFIHNTASFLYNVITQTEFQFCMRMFFFNCSLILRTSTTRGRCWMTVDANKFNNIMLNAGYKFLEMNTK